MSSKPKRIAIANFKGGSSKTTTGAAFATTLAAKGYKVLLVDTDTQATMRYALGALDSLYGLSDLSNGTDFEDVVYRFTDRHDSVKPRKNLDLICSKGQLENLTTKQMGFAWTLSEDDREGQLTDVMELVEENTNYDFIILDTSPTDGLINTNVFYYVREIIVPVSLDNYSVKGFSDFIEVFEKTKKRKSKRRDYELEISYIIPTRLDYRKSSPELLLQQLKEIVEVRLPGTKILNPIPECAKTGDCSIFNQSITEYAPKSRGGMAYIKGIEQFLKNYKKETKRNGIVEGTNEFSAKL